MNILKLAEEGEAEIKSGDLLFQDKVERVLAFLGSKSVLPIKRATQNGFRHTNFAAMIVRAFDRATAVDVSTRRHGHLHEEGHTTLIVKWLDAAEKQRFLLPVIGSRKAEEPASHHSDKALQHNTVQQRT